MVATLGFTRGAIFTTKKISEQLFLCFMDWRHNLWLDGISLLLSLLYAASLCCINKEAAKLTSGSFLARKLKTKWRKFILISILTVIIVFFYGFNLLIQMYSFFNSYCIEYKLETLGTYCGFIGFGSTTCAQDSVSAVSVLFLIYRDPALTIIIQLFFNIWVTFERATYDKNAIRI